MASVHHFLKWIFQPKLSRCFKFKKYQNKWFLCPQFKNIKIRNFKFKLSWCFQFKKYQNRLSQCFRFKNIKTNCLSVVNLKKYRNSQFLSSNCLNASNPKISNRMHSLNPKNIKNLQNKLCQTVSISNSYKSTYIIQTNLISGLNLKYYKLLKMPWCYQFKKHQFKP